MIGVVIVTHAKLGAELLNAAELILGRMESFATVSIEDPGNPEAAYAKIEAAIKEVDDGSGTLILTDMLGGSPSNLSLSFLADGKVEVLTGVNLPMLVKLVQSREKSTLAELAELVGSYGRKSISVAGQILSGQRPSS